MSTPFRLKRSSISGKRPELSDLQLGELALNFYDGYLFAERDTGGVGIATTIALLTPWTENYGAGSIHYLNSVAIGKENPTGSLDVVGHTELDNLNVSGIATIGSILDLNGTLNVSGVSTFTDTTDNTLGDSNTGAVQIDGGLGVDKNVTVGGNLDVQGYSNFVGVVTFRGGTINIGDANTDDVNIGGEFVSDLIPDETNLYNLGSDSKQWKNLYIDGTADVDALTVSGVSTFTGAIDANGDLDVDGVTELDITNISETLNVTGVSTFSSNVDINADIDVDGHTELDNLNVSGIATIATLGLSGDIDIDGHTDLDNVSISGVTTIFNTTDNTLGNENTGSVQLDGGMGIAKNLTVKQNLHVGGYSNFVGVVTFRGGTINLGDANTDDINIGGEFVSDLVPDETNLYSLGTLAKQWKDLYIDGTADVDALTVSGVSTFTGAIDANGDLDVDGHTELDNLRVSGVSTFVGAIDANGDLDVDGHTELDNVRITGVSTFTSPLDINTDVDIDGHTELDNVNIVGVTTFQSNAFFGDADYIQMGDAQDLKIGHVGSYSVILDQGAGNLSIGGDGFVDIMNTALDEYKARFTTNGSVELYFDNVNKFETTGYGATVFGTLQSQQLNVTGVSTFAGDADFNGHVDIDGHTELDNVNVSGVTTTGGLLDINAGGQANTFKVEDLTDNRVVIAGTGGELEDDANLTFNGSTLSVGVDLDVTGDLDVDGHTELDTVNVSAAATFAGGVTFNSSSISATAGLVANTAKVSDLTDNRVVIAGNAGELEDDARLTFNGSNLTVGLSSGFTVSKDGDLTLTDVSTTSSAGPELKLYRNSASPADADYLGQIKFAGESDTGVERNYAKITGKILDASNGEEDGIIEFAHIKAGSQNISARFRSDSLQLLNSTNFSVNGNTTLEGNLDVDGHTNLDNVNVSGVTTTGGLLDINSGGQANTFKVEDLTDNRVIIAGTGGELEDDANLTFNGSTLTVGVDLDVDGHTNLDNVSVAGVTTFTGNIDANGDLDVDGTTELDVLNVAETATFSSNIDVDGHTELDNVNISGIATATAFHTGAEGSAIRVTSNTISGPAEMFIDPAGVGDNTGALRIKGDLFVDGTQTVINSTTIELGDFIVGIATTATTDSLADGAGIKIGPDNTFLYDHSNTSLKSSENLNLTSGKTYKIDGTDVLSATTLGSGVVNSSLTSLGTLLGLTVSGQTTLNTLGITGVSTFTGAIDANGDLDVDGQTQLDHLNVAGVSTYTGDADFNGNIDVDGHTELDNVNISGIVTTFELDVDGHTNLDNVSVAGVTTTAGLLDINAGGQANTFKVEDLTDNRVVLAGTGGELEDDANLTFNGSTLTVGVGLDVDGHTELDNVNISGVTTFTGTLTASGSLNLSGDLDVDGHTNLDNVSVVGVTTFTGNVDANGDLDVDGHTNLDNVSVAGITTFAGKIVGAATDNVIPFLYSTLGDLPNAGTYHGAFAHVHNQGKGFFAHGGAWYELVNKEQNGIVGTGTERYNVGQIDATDVDVSGITTSVSLHVGVGGTVITASGIGSVGINSTTPAYALDVIGDINSSTDIKVNGVSIVSSGNNASLDDVVALAIALG